MKYLLLTGAFSYSDKQIQLLKQLGFDIDFLQMETEPIQSYEKYNAIVCNGLFLHHNIKKFKNLEYIQLTSVGYDRVPIGYIKKNNISLNNARGVYSIPIAEHAVMLILELLRNNSFFAKNQQLMKWEKNRTATELSGKTVVIAGCGSIGLEVAKKLSGFNTQTIGLDIHHIENIYLTKCYDINKLYSIAANADVFVSALPYCDENYHIFNTDFFSAMNNNGIFINISRGKLVDEKALKNALNNSNIKGAALDVFEDEPLPVKSALWGVNNLIITPHNSFVGDGNSERMFNVIYNNLKCWIKG